MSTPAFHGPVIRSGREPHLVTNYFWHWWGDGTLPATPAASSVAYHQRVLDYVHRLRVFGRHAVCSHLVCSGCDIRLNSKEHAQEHITHQLVNDGQLHSGDVRTWAADLYARHFDLAALGRVKESRLLQIMNEYVVTLRFITGGRTVVFHDEVDSCMVEIVELDRAMDALAATFILDDHLTQKERELEQSERDTLLALKLHESQAPQMTSALHSIPVEYCWANT